MKRFLSVLALVMALGPPALSAQVVTDTVEVVGVSEIVAIQDDCPRNSADKIQGKVGDTILCTLAAVDAQGDTVPSVFSVVAEQPDKLTAEVAGDALTLIILRNGSSRIFRTAAPAGVEPPPEPEGLYPNRPSGMTAIFQYDGTELTLPGWIYTPKWSSGTHMSVIADPTNPLGTGSSLRCDWDGVDVGCGQATLQAFEGGTVSELYTMYRVYYDPAYDHFEKHFYWGNDPTSRVLSGSPTQHFATYAGDSDTEMYMTQHASSARLLNASGVALAGTWHTLEWHMVAESAPGAGDGSVYLYYDGGLVDSNTAVQWTKATDPIVGFSGTQFFTRSGAVPSDDRWFKFGEWSMWAR